MSLYLELKEALEDVRDYRAGKRKDLRVTRFARPKSISAKDVIRIRKALRVNQREFALLLNSSVGAVRSWEQGARRPKSLALKLLTVAKTNPAALFARTPAPQAAGVAARSKG